MDNSFPRYEHIPHQKLIDFIEGTRQMLEKRSSKIFAEVNCLKQDFELEIKKFIATWEGNNENPYNKGKYISKSSLKIPIVTNAIKIKDKTKMLYVNESPKIVNIPLSNKIKLTPKGIKALTNVTPIMKKENRLFQSVIISDPFERNYIKHNSDHNSNRILSENMKDKISNWSMKYKPKEPKKIVITGKDRKHSYQKIANLNEKEIRIIPNDDSSADNSFSKLNSSINSVNLPKQSKEFLSYSQPTQAVKEIKKDNIEVSKFDPIADMRKFSILDVPGCALIKPDAIQSGDSSIHNSSVIMSGQIENQARMKAFYVLAKSDILPVNLRLEFSRTCRFVYMKYSPRNVMMDYTSLLRSNIDTLEKFIFNLKYFIPSKTAQNGLNFFTKEDERVLYNLPDDEKYEPVVGIFKFIYILLKEDTNGISNIIKHFFDTIMKKFKADNLKNLFLNTVCPDLYLINQEQIDRILSLVNNNRNFLKSTVIFKVSRPASFLSFIIKEIFDYVTSKGFVLGVDLKQEEDKLQTMKDELKKLNK